MPSFKSQQNYHVLGLMSGSSLDGLDIAWCHFKTNGKGWSYDILQAATIPYSKKWSAKLANAHALRAVDLFALHSEYGHWLGNQCLQFMRKHAIKKIDGIASHGHTVFHQPGGGFTFQLGDGNSIHAVTGLPIIFDFRSLDVQLQGQGAPLVPVGDELLFPENDACLNIGGIANVSLRKRGKRLAYDICFANMGLNYLARKGGLAYDKGGRLSSKGKVNASMLQSLKDFYKPFAAKRPSLAREHFEAGLQQLLDDEGLPLQDKLSTFTECIAIQVRKSVPLRSGQTLLITGGGAFNTFLVERLRQHFGPGVVLNIPSSRIIAFKEALVFAFLGVLRLQNKTNVLRSVTGAKRDSSSGLLIG